MKKINKAYMLLLALLPIVSACVIMPPDSPMPGESMLPQKVWYLKVDNAKSYCPPYHIKWSAEPLSSLFATQECEPSIYSYEGNIIPAKYLNTEFKDERGRDILMTFNIEKLTLKNPLVYSSLILDYNKTAHIVSLIYKPLPPKPQYVVPGDIPQSYSGSDPIVLEQQSY